MEVEPEKEQDLDTEMLVLWALGHYLIFLQGLAGEDHEYERSLFAATRKQLHARAAIMAVSNRELLAGVKMEAKQALDQIRPLMITGPEN